MAPRKEDEMAFFIFMLILLFPFIWIGGLILYAFYCAIFK